MTEGVPGVKCTHCGAHTPNIPVRRDGYDAGGKTFWATMISGNIQIVECAACGEEILVEKASGKAVWSLASVNAPEGVPHRVAEAYRDAKLALAVGSKIGALMAMRTMGVRLLRDKDFKKFSQLSDNGLITPAQYGVLDQNRLWANVFGHEDITTDKIELIDIAELFQFVRSILETIYTQPKIAERFPDMTKNFDQNK